MKIRGYRSSDLERCRSLWAELTQRHRNIYEDPSIGGDDPGKEFDRHFARVGPERIWVAEDGDQVLGFVSLIVEGKEAEIEPIIVGSRHRSGGIGRRLLDHAIAEAKRLEVLCLNVRPVARNREALSFFHEAGFRTLGHVQLFRWLGPATPGQWKEGPELLGMHFDY
ncbi:MAG: GNAT family N-acetyltransferase [Planctomycetota bacterium]